LNIDWDADLAAARLVRLGIPLDRRVGNLSGGQQAQVSLSLALGKRPNLLILDEPMASLDPLARQLFLEEVITVARDRQMTVIMSSHVIAELTRVCNFVVILQAGKVKACGSVESAIAARAGRGQVARTQRITELEEAVLGYLSDGAPE